jgi:hypothetical protein
MFKSFPIKLIEMAANANDPSAVSRGMAQGFLKCFFRGKFEKTSTNGGKTRGVVMPW